MKAALNFFLAEKHHPILLVADVRSPTAHAHDTAGLLSAWGLMPVEGRRIRPALTQPAHRTDVPG